MQWNKLTNLAQIKEIKEKSKNHKVVIFKHSTRCIISKMALKDFENNWNNEKAGNVTAYFLDLIKYRDLSNQLATEFGVTHQSPQILLIDQENCIFNTSHESISFEAITNYL